MYGRAGLILRNSSNEVLLLKGIGGKWSFPKGVPESVDNNDPIKTAIRECREEAGLLEGTHYSISDASPLQAHDGLFFYGDLCKGSEREVKLQDSEVCDYKWVSPRRCPLPSSELNAAVRWFLRSAR